MASKATRRLYTQTRASTIATRKAATQDRRGDFKDGMSALDAIFGNLSTTIRGTGRSLSRQQSRQADLLARLATKDGSRAVARAETAIANRYGVAGTAGAAPTLAQAEGHVEGNRKAARGFVGGAAALKKSGASAVQIAEAGAVAARAGADREMADALRYRAMQDARIVAEQQFALQQMKLQAKLELETYRKKLELEEKAAGSPTGATAVGSMTAGALPELVQLFRSSHQEDGWAAALGVTDFEKGASPAMVAQQWAAEHGYTTESPQYAVVLAMANELSAGGAGLPGATWDRDDIVRAATTTIDTLYPNLKPKQRTAIVGMMTTSLLDASLARAYEEYERVVEDPDEAAKATDDGGRSLLETMDYQVHALMQGHWSDFWNTLPF